MLAPVRSAMRGLAALVLCSLSLSAQVLIGPPAALHSGDAENVHVGDLNNDGHLDLFVVPDFLVFTDNTSYSVALGNGDGTFAPAVVTSSDCNYWGRGELVDLDDDGNLDFVVPADSPFLDPHLRVYRGAGDGTFSLFAAHDPQLFSGSVLAVRDVDADGDKDVLMAKSAFGGGSLLVYLANDLAPGGFVKLSAITIGGSTLFEFVSDLDTADLDGDGFLEIVATSFDSLNGTAHVAILHGTGPATWSPQVLIPLPAAPQALALSDLDGNGDIDLVVRDASGNVRIALGNGDTTFGPAAITPVGPVVAANATQHVEVGDLDGDGVPDLVVPTGTAVTVLRNLGDGTLVPMTVSQTWGADGVGLGDFDEDGDLDLAAAGSTNCGSGDCPGVVFVLSNETYAAGSPFTDLGAQLAGAAGFPIHLASGTLVAGRPFLFDVFNAPPFSAGYIVVGASELALPFKGGTLVPSLDVIVMLATDGAGRVAAGGSWPHGIPSGTALWLQWWFADAGGVAGKSATSALRAVTP